MPHLTQSDRAAIRRMLAATTPQEIRAAVRGLSDAAYRAVQTLGADELREAVEDHPAPIRTTRGGRCPRGR